MTKKEAEELAQKMSAGELALLTFIGFMLDEHEKKLKSWLHDWFLSMKGNGLL